MQIDWFTFIAQVINFLILIALLQRFLYKPVMKAMENREQKIASELEEARLKKVEAEQQERELENQLNDFQAQKNQLLEDARAEVAEQQKEWLEELRKDISELRTKWTEAVESEKESFLLHLKKETGDNVVDLLEKVLVDLSEENLQQQTERLFFEKLDQLNNREISQLKETIQELKEPRAEILSSFELESEQKDKLKRLLSEIANGPLECKFSISESLGFGLEVNIGGWRLGWNLESYLDGLQRDMEQFFQNHTPIQRSTKVK